MIIYSGNVYKYLFFLYKYNIDYYFKLWKIQDKILISSIENFLKTKNLDWKVNYFIYLKLIILVLFSIKLESKKYEK